MKNLFYLSLLCLITISACKKEPKATATIVFQDDLTTDNQTFPIDSNIYSTHKFYQGHYSIRVDSSDHMAWGLAPYASINFPYTVQVDGTPVLDDTSQIGNVAVIFNLSDNNNFTIAEIWTNSTFRIWTRVNGVSSTLVGYTYNSAIQAGSGSKYTIKVIQNQSNLELQVNNVSMGTFNIALPSLLVGTGPAVALGTARFTPVTGLFNNFSIAKN